MITSLDKKDLVALGARYRGGHLIQQANYTLALAGRAPEIAALLPAGFLGEAEKALRVVEKGAGELANVKAESRDATRVQNDTLRRVREWRRRLAALARMARRSGATLPAPLDAVGDSVRTVPAAVISLHAAVELLRKNAKIFDPFPLYHQVLGEAESYAASLAAVDAAQEAKSLVERPAAVRAYYAAKATLFTALQIVNDAARAAYAGDPATAARFNLSILYRPAGRPRPPAAPPAPAPPAV